MNGHARYDNVVLQLAEAVGTCMRNCGNVIFVPTIIPDHWNYQVIYPSLDFLLFGDHDINSHTLIRYFIRRTTL